MGQTSFARVLPHSIYNWLYGLRSQIAIWSLFNEDAVRNRNKRLRSLKGIYKNHRCFIMGNGPSLNKMDLKLLGNDYVWGTNRCYLLFDRINWRPKFYVAVDKRVVPDNRKQIDNLPRQMPDTKFFYPVKFRVRDILHSTPNTYWYDEKPVRIEMDELPEGTFTTDASKGVYATFTVTVAAMQLAVFLGFNPIYLIGCDTTYVISATVQAEGKNLDRLISTMDDDPNHFDSKYFGRGKKYHEPHVARMLFHYHEARLVCESLGVKIYNATIGGNLEEYQRVNYRDLF
jgi:Protein of unknown function DUF115